MVEKLQKEVDALRKTKGTDDMHVENDEDDDEDEARLQTLTSELAHVESFVKCIEGTSPLHASAQSRAEEIRAEVAAIKEKKGGPEAKVLGLAGRHERELRSARKKRLQQRKAQSRLEEEVSTLAKELQEVQDKLEGKTSDLEAIKAEALQAQADLERLSKSGAAEAAQDVEGGEHGDDPPKGPRARVQRLEEQLAAFLPGNDLKAQLAALVAAGVQAAEQKAAATLRSGDDVRQRSQQQQPQQNQTGHQGAGNLPPAPASGGSKEAPSQLQKPEGVDAGRDQRAAETSSTGGWLSTPPPVMLAPHGQLGPAANAGTTSAAGSAEGASAGGQAASGTKGGGESEEELLEEAPMDVEKAIEMLPKPQRAAIRTALAARGGKPDKESRDSSGRDRERSPRPTNKGGDSRL